VAILGLSYNDASAYVIESPSLALIRSLHRRGIRVVAHDARAMNAALGEAGAFFVPAASAEECVQAAPVVVLVNRDRTYTDAVVRYRGDSDKIVVDCWRVLDPKDVASNVRIVKFGFLAPTASVPT
jgi:UDP-N-acetyl-D-mannosaminuronate dehydrogenase